MHPVSFEQIRGAPGSLLLLWSAIEDALARRQAGGPAKPVHGAGALLAAWDAALADDPGVTPYRRRLAATLRAQLTAALEIRNGICHGLVGLAAEAQGRPASLTFVLNGSSRTLDWTELQAHFGRLARVPRAIDAISSPGAAPRHEDTEENRHWWRAEFGLVAR